MFYQMMVRSETRVATALMVSGVVGVAFGQALVAGVDEDPYMLVGVEQGVDALHAHRGVVVHATGPVRTTPQCRAGAVTDDGS
ncbi:hypothetical protein AB0M43_35840 [Longispora sp. NPDC051575]|uniref:hypothetical protein n=1 Tax=Longispora sp. NPDC051575 TaxID=3154943 RepID=UPI00344302E8